MAEQTVHIVDDEEAVRDSLSVLLETVGFPVVSYASAEEFLAAREAGIDGLVLLDARMPGLNGFGLLDELMESDMELPVVMISGHGDDDFVERAMRKGAAAFIQKPFTDERLLETIRQSLPAEDEGSGE
jgi:FixJ family two-component response regulator